MVWKGGAWWRDIGDSGAWHGIHAYGIYAQAQRACRDMDKWLHDVLGCVHTR